jgi:hypothetical protein
MHRRTVWSRKEMLCSSWTSHDKLRPVRVLLVLWALAGCSSLEDHANERSGRDDCEEIATCNGLVEIDCHSAVDGPRYYYDSDSGQVVSECGGACHDAECAAVCPPPQWTCER